jgi:hypothetical protein
MKNMEMGMFTRESLSGARKEKVGEVERYDGAGVIWGEMLLVPVHDEGHVYTHDKKGNFKPWMRD